MGSRRGVQGPARLQRRALSYRRYETAKTGRDASDLDI